MSGFIESIKSIFKENTESKKDEEKKEPGFFDKLFGTATTTAPVVPAATNAPNAVTNAPEAAVVKTGGKSKKNKNNKKNGGKKGGKKNKNQSKKQKKQ